MKRRNEIPRKGFGAMRTIPSGHGGMRCLVRVLAVLLVMIALGASAQAQSSTTVTPQYEATGAFSYVRGNGADADSFNLFGGSGEFTYNVRHWFGLTADAGAYRFQGLPAGISSAMYTYTGGPRFTLRNHNHFIPFGQALIGGGRLTASSGGVHAGENSFVFIAGGGVDVPLTRRFAIRAGQVEYLLTRFDQTDGSSATQHNLRLSCGVVFRFGEK